MLRSWWLEVCLAVVCFKGKKKIGSKCSLKTKFPIVLDLVYAKQDFVDANGYY